MRLFCFKESDIVVGSGKSFAQLWMIIASVFLGINLFLILTLLQITPRLKVVAQVLTVTPMNSGQFLQVEPFNQETSDKKLIDEMLIRFYMDSRHNSFGDKLEMTYRWGKGGPVHRLSSPKVYNEFAGNFKEKINAASKQKSTTSIRIMNITIRQNNIYDIEFEKYKLTKGVLESRRKNAVLKVAYSSQYKSLGRLPINPYGMYVVYYNETNKLR